MRVVVTGMGVVSPIGTGVEQFWNAAIDGVSGIDMVQSFDSSKLIVLHNLHCMQLIKPLKMLAV